MDLSLLFEIMLVGTLGIGSQWLAWKFNWPAIVIMSAAGLLAGPILGIMNPEQNFGDLYSPIVSVAVAIILFDGSLSLYLKELIDLGKLIRRSFRLVDLLALVLCHSVDHFIAVLSFAVSFVVGGVLTMTGPPVIVPLVPLPKLKTRPAKILKW